jgi:hypothetical protein
MALRLVDVEEGKKQQATAMSEKELSANVIDAALKLGWLVACWPTSAAPWSRTGTYPGIPDAEFVHPKGYYLKMEFKRQKGRLSMHQQRWIKHLLNAGIETYVIRPSDWLSGEVERMLRV